MQTGLFAKKGSYKGIMRINAINGGLARVSMRFNVPANDHDLRVLDEAAPTAYPDQFNQIDFLMAEDFKTFPFETLDELNKAMKLKNEPKFWDLITHFFGQHGYLQSIKNFAKVAYSDISDNTKGIVGKNFYGALPYLAGKHSAVKWGIQAKQDHPLRPEQILGGKKLKNFETEGKEVEAAEKHLAALKEWMGEHPEGAKWDFVVQPAKDFDEMNIEVAKFGWSEKESPYMPVGTIHIHKQDIDTTTALNKFASPSHGENVTPFDNVLQFNPWNMCKAHRPLGPLNRARKDVYNAAGDVRRGHGNGANIQACPFLNLMEGTGSSGGRGRDQKIKEDTSAGGKQLRKRSPSSRERL